MKRFLIVDGSNLLFQMFFGMPARIVNEQGRHIQGTLGFVGALLKIINMIEPTNIAVIFDGEHENDRNVIDKNYKSNRADYSELSENENPYSQIQDIYSALDCLGIRHTETLYCETDDIISSYVYKYRNNTQIIISSFDSDFFQLISDNVSVLRYRGKKTEICNSDYIKEKFAINPEQYADYKSLVGDNSDNIKGAEKVGRKTASLLLNEFGSLKNIIENAEKIRKPSVRNSVINNKEKLMKNYTLIKLCNAEPLHFLLNETEYTNKNLKTTEVLKAIGLK